MQSAISSFRRNRFLTRASAAQPAQTGEEHRHLLNKEGPTEDDLYRVQGVLQRCVQEGKIDMIKSSMISSDMQKCMRTGQPMKDEYYKFLQKELAKEAN